ncbi:hypothetical protein Syun_027952 [Stephania yunnanensis]|uniref:Uncharacterized protein n=1 Tax=Stephania yunnanensis TaxID=152371 RepID=A0AAP0EGH8_9MAGN
MYEEQYQHTSSTAASMRWGRLELGQGGNNSFKLDIIMSKFCALNVTWLD